MEASFVPVGRRELMEIVDARKTDVRAFLNWSADKEARPEVSMLLRNRGCVVEAGEVANASVEPWWGVAMYTCFGTKGSALRVLKELPAVAGPADLDEALQRIQFVPAKVNGHRKQPGLKGALKAVHSLCGNADLFRDVLHSDLSFEDRYRRLGEARLPQWGRTTIFDLLVRSGSLGIGGAYYQPSIAYLAGSTGPWKGFRKIWVAPGSDEPSFAWAEGLLQAWCANWSAVARRVGAKWRTEPYGPGDLENALCIYQEEVKDADVAKWATEDALRSSTSRHRC